jgi:hypothetical protein
VFFRIRRLLFAAKTYFLPGFPPQDESERASEAPRGIKRAANTAYLNVAALATAKCSPFVKDLMSEAK